MFFKKKKKLLNTRIHAAVNMSKQEEPPHIKVMEKVNAKYNEADLIADTTEVDMGKDFHEALDEIRDKNGRINYKLFDPEKNGDKYHHKVLDKYMGKLKKRITDKMGKEHTMSDAELSLAIEGMYGETKKAYLDTLAKSGSKFRISDYKANLDEFVKNLRGRLYSRAEEDITTEHHKAILKEITKGKKGIFKNDDLSEFDKPLFRNDIAQLIRYYYESNGGEVSRELLKNTKNLSGYLGKEKDAKIVYMHEKDQMKKAA
jgi:hypothetical protein